MSFFNFIKLKCLMKFREKFHFISQNHPTRHSSATGYDPGQISYRRPSKPPIIFMLFTDEKTGAPRILLACPRSRLVGSQNLTSLISNQVLLTLPSAIAALLGHNPYLQMQIHKAWCLCPPHQCEELERHMIPSSGLWNLWKERYSVK